uniref:Rhodanese domain-containing protein n=1 Tax=Macrostomum lignano TaxID=282301 RepID=A0A1I8HU88_9PLAT
MHAYKARPKPIDPLQKRIPRNPKYANVKSTIDTGASITKYMKKIEEIRENYRFRQNEIFKRMKATTFVQLMLQVTEINRGLAEPLPDAGEFSDAEDDLLPAESERTLCDGDDGQPARAQSAQSLAVSESDYGRPVSTARSTLQSVISGVGELDENGGGRGGRLSAMPEWPEETPYLLLDVREREEYERCRIIGAVSYPYTMLSRAQNYEIPQMLACRNRPGRIVLIYDEDEKIAPRVATTLVQRGYDNLFMLSGGLRVAVKLFPRASSPARCRKLPALLLQSAASQRANDADQLDVDKLAAALDQALDTGRSSAATSRSGVSRGRPHSTASSAASSVGSSVSQRPPFK